MSPWMRKRAARARIPAPRFSHYIRCNTWHVCRFSESLPYDSDAWIEIEWAGPKIPRGGAGTP